MDLDCESQEDLELEASMQDNTICGNCFAYNAEINKLHQRLHDLEDELQILRETNLDLRMTIDAHEVIENWDVK